MSHSYHNHDQLPRTGPEREALREKGQFWTPPWVAEAMVGYLVANGCQSIFDPAVGSGAFFLGAKSLEHEIGRQLRLAGNEIDPNTLMEATSRGLTAEDLRQVEINDFVLSPPPGPFEGIVANPPYIRHHRLKPEVKTALQHFGAALIGKALDGRAGLHVYFLIRALTLLRPGGCLAFIMPADTCEGVFASKLWSWVTRRYCLEAVVAFEPQASPFPGVDTNPLIFMIRASPPKDRICWAKCLKADTPGLKSWVLSKFLTPADSSLYVERRALHEAVTTGLSRPSLQERPHGPTLADFAYVMRGIATGANEYFLLSETRAKELGIPNEYLVPAVSRTRDVGGDQITPTDIRRLEDSGKPTLLLSLGAQPIMQLPAPVQSYIKLGEGLNLDKRPLISSRTPWYKMESRIPPPFLFAYLGRRNARFIRNLAGVVPLTGFLCVYPHNKTPDHIERLWAVLRDHRTTENLRFVGKSYGSGAIKVEPRALERLRLPSNVVRSAGLAQPSKKSPQLPLLRSVPIVNGAKTPTEQLQLL